MEKILLTKQDKNQFLRQTDLINMPKLRAASVTLIGAGSVGSYVAQALAKMGVGSLEVFDEDGVSEHNLPAQFYGKNDVNRFKVDALKDILDNFAPSAKVKMRKRFFTKDKVSSETIIVTTDNMSSRKNAWEQFLKNPKAKNFIDARMGAEIMKIYVIRDKSKEAIKFYTSTLHSDEESVQLPCTARTIIYNVLIVAGLVARAFKGVIQEEEALPNEFIFNLSHFEDIPFMTNVYEKP